jgi:hypothetical protein
MNPFYWKRIGRAFGYDLGLVKKEQASTKLSTTAQRGRFALAPGKHGKN